MIRLDTFKLQAVSSKTVLDLTPNEYRILYLLYGLGSAASMQITEELGISSIQVKTHMCNLNTKLGKAGFKRIKTETYVDHTVRYMTSEKIRLIHKFS